MVNLRLRGKIMSKIDGVSSYRRYLQGDDSALEELIIAYGDLLVRFAYCFVRDSYLAEDIVQDAFATLIFKRRHFSDCDNLRAYLYKTVRNKCVDALRSSKKRVPLEDLENVLTSGDAESETVLSERNAKLYKCLQALSPQYAEVLYLVYIDGEKPKTASKIIKKTEKQTYNLIARAKIALKERLIAEEIFNENE